ncbi:MAG: hypothetical protein EP338_08720 [Bacteroidetes bacterium]|nr:MAG: hypothetical protein EP338_08720 [Bacteroidota bacterium]
MIYKKISSICFALAFLCAVPVFTNYFSDYISPITAKYGILIFGGIAFLANILAFQSEGKNANYNLIFWIGSIIVFAGLIFRIMHWPYGYILIILGGLVLGVSFFYNPFANREEDDKNDLLDN